MNVSVYDVILLQNYFASKREPSDQDKMRLAKLDQTLAKMVDDLFCVPSGEKLNIAEIFEKLTGEKLENYR